MLISLKNLDEKDVSEADKIFAQCIAKKEKKFRRYFNDRLSCLEYLSNALNGDGLVLPGLLSEGPATCIGSVFSGYNFLLFKESGSEDFFYVLQHNNGCSGFYFPKNRILIAPGSIVSFFKKGGNAKKIESELDALFISLQSFKKAKFLGVLDGYSRPYHYFYDRLPSLISIVEEIPNLRIFSFSSSFFPGLPEGKVKLSSIQDVNIKARFSHGFFFQTFRFPGMSHQDLVLPVLRHVREGGNNLYVDYLRGSRSFVWVGLCEEKRHWGGKAEAIGRFVEMAKSILEEPVFIFDGMTCPSLVSVSDFRNESCKKDIELLEAILRIVGDIDYIDLIGAKSDKKITLGQYVDFFFSSALTDSIWPSHFGFSKGVVYAANVANINVHNHPLAFLVPGSYVKDADDGIDNWARKGYEIDQDALDFFLEHGLSFAADVKRKVKEFGILSSILNSGSSSYKLHARSGNNFVVLENFQDLAVPVYGVSKVFNVRESFEIFSDFYNFKLSFWCESSVEFTPYLVFYSSLGEEVDRVLFGEGGELSLRVKESAKYYRLFSEVCGSGKIFFNGFYAQPLLEEYMAYETT